jgi:hypothetical protein
MKDVLIWLAGYLAIGLIIVKYMVEETGKFTEEDWEDVSKEARDYWRENGWVRMVMELMVLLFWPYVLYTAVPKALRSAVEKLKKRWREEWEKEKQ